MPAVNLCEAFCASPQVIQDAAFELIKLVKAREDLSSAMDDCQIDPADIARLSAEEINLKKSMSQVLQICAVTRAWIDNARDNPNIDFGDIPDRVVGDYLYRADGTHLDFTLRESCNCVIHANAMWLSVSDQGNCVGSRLNMRMPEWGNKPLRIASLCLTTYAAAALNLVDFCHDCAGSIDTQNLIQHNGMNLPESIAIGL